jgi:outer membrane immunogenic protein
MRRLLLAALALAALVAGPARAADLAYRAPLAPAPPPSWAGLYLGLNAGGGVATGEFLDNCFTCASLQINEPAFAVGAQLGYNWQRGNLVYGLEGDLDWIGASKSGIFAAGDPCCGGTATLKMDAFGSIRGRLGLAFDSALLYVTAGPAFGHFDSSVALCSQPGCGVFGIHDTSTDRTWLPGIAAGAGVEYMLTKNLSLRGEFLYLLFRNDNKPYLVNASGAPEPSCIAPPCGVNYNYSAALARVGLDYKFLPGNPQAEPAISRPVFYKAPPAPAAGPNWAGPYLGLNAGGGLVTGQFLDPCFTCADLKISEPSFTAGAQLGYNWQWGAAVAGLEGDFNWVGASKTLPYAIDDACCVGTATLKMDSFASIRGRLGLAYDSALVYVTAGPAFGHFNSAVALCTQPGCDPRFSNQDTSTDRAWLPGIAAGAGVEYMLTSNLSIRGEFLYLLFKDDNTSYIINATGRPELCPNSTTGPATCGINYTYSAAIARLGLNWKFMPAGSPGAGSIGGLPVKAPASRSPVADWRGFYVGLNAGGGIATGQFLDPCFVCADLAIDEPAFSGGAQIGYNWQWRSLVLGAEGDFNWISANKSEIFDASDPGGIGTATLKMDAFGSLRGRLGLAYDNALAYVTAGPAVGHFNSSVALCTLPGCLTTSPFVEHDTSTDRAWLPGIAAGAGVEFKLTGQLSLRGEFLYLLFKDDNTNYIVNATGQPQACPRFIAGAPLTCGINYTYSAEIGRVGLDWKLN